MATPMDVDDHTELIAQKTKHPELAEQVDQLDRLVTQKLYHQFVTLLTTFVKSPCYQVEGNKDLVVLFDKFIRGFQSKMSELTFIKILQCALAQMTGDEALAVLEPYLEKWKGQANQVGTIVKGGLLARVGKLQEARDMLELRRDEMEGVVGIDAFIFSALYKNLVDIARAQKDWQRFYNDSLMYLAYTPVADIPEAGRANFAVEVTEATLVIPLEFNFGELMETPLIKQELATASPALSKLLLAFHEGSFQAFDDVMAGKHGPVPLTAHKAALTSKMALAALMELVFSRGKRSRVFTFEEVATYCRTELNLVEHLIMKAMSVALVDGKMDQIDRTVTFTRVKPRVLDEQRMAVLKTRIDAWTASAAALCAHLDELTPELLVA
jgi:26S proteasome regulatory subunit N9